MKRAFLVATGLTAYFTTVAGAENIYMLSSTDTLTDDAAIAALTSRGHTVTLGLPYSLFDGSVDLSGFQTVYLQANFNWTGAAMPAAGQQQLVDWVNTGGRLVTCEWVTYYTYVGGKFATLAVVIPGTQTFSYGNLTGTTYTQVTANASINAGVPASLSFLLTSYTGTEVFSVAKPGATVFYSTINHATAGGLLGWAVGAGSVFSFGSTCGPDQTGDETFGILFANVMRAVIETGGGCGSADFNNDGDTGTDADIEAFFACLAGACCATCPGSADFDGDGDVGTDADIEAFFRVLAGGTC